MSALDRETHPMMHLLGARRRYFDLCAALPRECALDLDLHDELTQLISRLDRMIAENAGDQPWAAVSGDMQVKGTRTPARRRRSARVIAVPPRHHGQRAPSGRGDHDGLRRPTE